MLRQNLRLMLEINRVKCEVILEQTLGIDLYGVIRK